jgi:hypothetical protein
MASRTALTAVFLAFLPALNFAAESYNGPKPPKPDVAFLLHADNLVETEALEAKEETRKDETIYTVPGAASPVRTPLAEPIFLIQAEKIVPEKLSLFRLEVKDGNRRVAFNQKKRKDNPKPIRFITTEIEGKLYRIEVNEPLENGEYSLSPAGSNQVFCFQVY